MISPVKMPRDVLYTFNPGAIKVNGEYIMIMDVTTLDDIHRFWIARSKDGYNFTPDPEPMKMPPPDLVYWGNSRPVMYKGKTFRDGFKMGSGAVPIKTDKGWLEIYHAVSTTCNSFIYRLKACLLDLEKPWEIIGHSDFILWPEHDYEMCGRVANVVFTCNAIPEEDGSVKIYYGASDTNIGLAEGKISELVELCLK